MLITKIIELKTTNKNVGHYQKNYDVKSGNVIQINVEHLPIKSKQKVKVKCDICNTEYEINYSNYLINIKNDGEYHCKKCFNVRLKKTNLKVYGVEYALQSDEVKGKQVRTNIEKYGVPYVAQSDKIKAKIKKTCTDRYGEDSFMKTESFRKKSKDTMIEKYGVDSPLKNSDIKHQVEQTCIDKYGFKTPLQSDEIKEKISISKEYKYGDKNFNNREKYKETNLVRFGVDNPMKSDNIREKVSIKTRAKLNDLIERANKKHDNFYDYSLIIDHKSMQDDIQVICHKHGEFTTNWGGHIIKGRGCPTCALENAFDTQEDFINKAKKVHGDLYDYSKVEYIKSKSKVEIICKKHGSSFFPLAGGHLNKKSGCPKCKESKGERLIMEFFKNNNIEYEYQKSFPDLKDKGLLFFDFYIPKLNLCVEFDGEQHFRSVEGWGGEETFENVQRRDEMKNDYCKINNIKLFRLSYVDYDKKDIEKKLELLLALL